MHTIMFQYRKDHFNIPTKLLFYVIVGFTIESQISSGKANGDQQKALSGSEMGR